MTFGSEIYGFDHDHLRGPYSPVLVFAETPHRQTQVEGNVPPMVPTLLLSQCQLTETNRGMTSMPLQVATCFGSTIMELVFSMVLAPN